MINLVSCTLAFLLIAVLSACVQPRSTIVATNLRGQAVEEVGTFGGLFDRRSDVATAEDPFVAALDAAKAKYEKDYLSDITKAPADIDSLPAYVRGRITQVNDLCKIYFDGLVRRDQTNELFKSGTSLASNITSGVLGLTGAAAFQLSVLALSEAALLGGLETYEEIYLLGPTPEVLYAKVRKTQDMFRKGNSALQTKDYAVARDFVREYAAYCTPERIRQIVIEDLEDDDEAGTERLQQIADNSIVQIINNTIDQSLSGDQAADLVIALGLTKPSSDEQSNAKERLMKAGFDVDSDLTNSQRTELQDDLEVLEKFNGAPALFQLAISRKPLGNDG